MRLGYLYSRYPVLSQTFCDTEMLELERRGWSFEIGSMSSAADEPPPRTRGASARADSLRAAAGNLKFDERRAKENGRWPEALDRRATSNVTAPADKAALRARNALYFADLFERARSRAFSRPLRESRRADRAFRESDFADSLQRHRAWPGFHGRSRQRRIAPRDLRGSRIRRGRNRLQPRPAAASAARMPRRKFIASTTGWTSRIFPRRELSPRQPNEPVRILSVGRLVEFKGFRVPDRSLRRAATARACNFHCEIIGDGPLRENLDAANRRTAAAASASLWPVRCSQEEIFAALARGDIFALAFDRRLKRARATFFPP